jgi:membrane protease YdiL (CAAX protease family)
VEFGGGAFQGIVAWSLLLSCIATIGLLWLIAKWRGFNPRVAGFMNPVKPLVLIASLLFGVGYSLAFNSFSHLPASLPLFEGAGSSAMYEAQMILYGSLLMALVGSTLVPIAEELAYRGYALNELRRGVGLVISFILTSFIFGILHGTVLWALMAGVLGMIFAWISLRTRSVYPAILAHIGVNGATFIFVEVSKMSDSFSSVYIDFMQPTTLLIMMFVGMSVLVTSFTIIMLRSEKASTIGPAPEPAPKPVPVNPYYGYPQYYPYPSHSGYAGYQSYSNHGYPQYGQYYQGQQYQNYQQGPYPMQHHNQQYQQQPYTQCAQQQQNPQPYQEQLPSTHSSFNSPHYPQEDMR